MKLYSIILIIFAAIGNPLLAQQKTKGTQPSSPSSNTGSPNSSTPQSNSPGGGSGLQGYQYTRGEWDTKLTQIPEASDFGPQLHEKDMVFVCYQVAPAENAAIPFVLENTLLDATPDIPVWQSNHHYQAFDLVYPPERNGHYYLVQTTGISGTGNPAFPEDGGTITEDDGDNLIWKDMGKLGYSPFVPSWRSGTLYAKGDLVTSKEPNSHFYEALRTGKSGNNEPKFRSIGEGRTIGGDGDLLWKDMGDMVTHHKHQCATVTSAHPFIMNQNLVVVVDMIAVPQPVQKRFTILNFNVTSQAAGSITPTPVQPSISAGTASISGGSGPLAAAGKQPTNHQLYYLPWYSLISGDTVNTINVNLVYTPVAPGLPWEAATFYPAGSVVISNPSGGPANTRGHYYIARNSGISASDTAPDFPSHYLNVATFQEGSGLTWKDLGPTPPPAAPGSTLTAWQTNTSYGTGDLVTPPSAVANGHYYRAAAHANSGSAEPSFATHINGDTFSETTNLSWTDMGPIPAVNPPPSSIWASGHTYYTGDLITPYTANGHYYRAQASGTSGANRPSFPANRTSINDGTNLIWIDMGPTVLVPAPATWSANTAYSVGATVVPSSPNGHYYQATSSGVTGLNSPPFPLDGSTIAETNGLVWLDAGTVLTAVAKLKNWVPNTAFMVGDTIQDISTAHYYTVIQAGISGLNQPAFSIPPPQSVPENNQAITWQDLGTTLPASLSVGQPPSDQIISADTYSFPQSHMLSYFTITSGVVISSIQSKTFLNTSATASMPDWKSFNNGHIVDPVLSLVTYVKPVDTEKAWRFRAKDLIPGPTIGFSLTSPANNFYFGGSSGFFNKNIQVLYGLSLARLSVLQPASLQLSSMTPATRSQFAHGGFVGVSFNILGLITSLPSL